MITITSKNGCLIRFTDERLDHIVTNHPEMMEMVSYILETIEEPDLIMKGDFGELIAGKIYDKTPVSINKYLVVVYKESDSESGFIITAYYTSKLNKSRDVIWKR